MLKRTVASPKSLRKGLEHARGSVSLLADTLELNASEKRWGVGKLCATASGELRELLKQNDVPSDYKVAVVGRFKAGKSSFVNELLGKKLAGEDTNPETAAITSFKYGPRVQATIKLISREDWNALLSSYSADNDDPEAHRVKKWEGFKKSDDTQRNPDSETFDLRVLQEELLKPGGRSVVIEPRDAKTAEEQRKSEAEFRRRIKEFTSGSKPHHCLVERIEIETPSPILEEGVTLIDTPGLDDTERFRVELTEKIVNDVDCALFLTKSGASYGQSEKEFLLTLLRKGTLKQLIVVVTQVDQTYDQHVRAAEDDDLDADTIEQRIAIEKKRIREALLSTLQELTKDIGEASTAKYSEQLENVEITFTSAANHRDWQKKRNVPYPILPSDPGGMDAAQERLFGLLSSQSRIATARESLRSGSQAILSRTVSNLEQRRSTMKNLRSREEAERKLGNFRNEFKQACDEFQSLIQDDRNALVNNLSARLELQQLSVDKAVLKAREVLADYETNDASKHWKSRRHKNWGFMHQIQTRIANAVFPIVGAELTSKEKLFAKYLERFQDHIDALSKKGEMLCEDLGIAEEFELSLTDDLETFLETKLDEAQQIVEAEEEQIASMLDQFVDDEVAARLADARDQVSDVWGRGTTALQTRQVRDFYREVKVILGEALSTHASKRFTDFDGHLVRVSEGLPFDAVREIETQIERASEDIKSAAEATLSNDRDAFFAEADRLVAQMNKSIYDMEVVVPEVRETSSAPATEASDVAEQIEPTASNSGELEIRSAAVNLQERMVLKNGSRRWPWEKVFKEEYMRDAEVAWVRDPYLAKRHQQRNLKEVIATILRTSKLKTLHIVTSIPNDAEEADLRHDFERLEGEIYDQSGLSLKLVIEEAVHDRYVTLDNGHVWKLGRGLDIYKPATGLASADQGLRQVRECEIDVFSTRNHA